MGSPRTISPYFEHAMYSRQDENTQSNHQIIGAKGISEKEPNLAQDGVRLFRHQEEQDAQSHHNLPRVTNVIIQSIFPRTLFGFIYPSSAYFFIAGIQSNQFTEVVHLDDIVLIHRTDSQLIFFWIAE